MKQSSVELSAGVFVLLGLVAVAWFAIQAGARIPLAGSTYAVNARFSNAGGLKPGSQVFLAGVPVGRVGNINLDPQYAAVVRLEVNKEVQLPNDTIASIRTSGLIGDKFVALSPGSSSQNLGPGSTITDTESAVDLESIISRFAFGNVSPAPSERCSGTTGVAGRFTPGLSAVSPLVAPGRVLMGKIRARWWPANRPGPPPGRSRPGSSGPPRSGRR